jgi:hypothetical protein
MSDKSDLAWTLVFQIVTSAGHLRDMAYVPTPQGIDVIFMQLSSGYSEAEAASHIAVVTMARDLKETGSDLFALMNFVPHARLILEHLKAYKDGGLMREEIWRNDSTAIGKLSMVPTERDQWIARVLIDPVSGKNRLANSRIDYSREIPPA